MSRRRKSPDATPFDTLRLEGSLFVPQLLEKAARGEAALQREADYAIPPGLKRHDEYGRAYRIATALWQTFAASSPRADLDPAAVTRGFALDFLREALGYHDLRALDEPVAVGSNADRAFPVTASALGGRLPVVIAPHSLGLDEPDARFAIIGSGARKKSGHQLAQEFLNASSDSLWAIVTNGKTLRLLRDADTLTRPNFLEFDLETILRDGHSDRYADFSALWLLLHASRAGSPDAAPADCVWEKWKSEGHAQGVRVRDGLRDGVQQALLTLGRGFLSHPANEPLRQRLHDGSLSKDTYFQQLLRLVYRWLFLCCAEERDLLHAPDSNPAARQAYATGYSLRRLRSRALRQSAHDPHGDLWQSLRIVFRGLAHGQERLALPALGGLFAESQCPDLDGAALTNRDLLSAMRELRWFFDRKSGKRSAIDYRNMGPEELGSVYESLLELIPTLDLPARAFGFAGITDSASTSGNARKTTGSFYTPDPLVMELIRSALEPVIRQRLADARELAALPWAAIATRIATDSVQRSYVHAWLVKHAALPADASPETFGRVWDSIPAAARANPLCAEALLSITVCDPSCGSGHFLLAAARRLAEKLAELRAPDGAVRPDDYRHALREVASRCLYGVDINPMAVELCRVALWLETVDPGKPLGFLNHHIRHGNSLLGTTPDLIAAGLPDETFAAIEGDDKPACAELRKRNKKEREGFGPLFEKEEQFIRARLRLAATQIEAMDDSQTDALQKKEAAFYTNETAPEYRHAKLLADLWCAAFVIKKLYPATEGISTPVPSPISDLPSPIEGHLLHSDDDLFGQPVPAAKPTAKRRSSLKTENFKLGTAHGITTGTLRKFVQGQALPEALEKEVAQLASQYRFFHWHLAFPQVFDQGGFDCILGNPPWDTLSPDAKEFFAAYDPEVRVQQKDDQDATIARLLQNPSLARLWQQTRREVFACISFIKNSGRFKMFAEGNLGKGDFNIYRMFVELALNTLRSGGYVGQVVPEGFYNGANCAAVRQSLFATSRVTLLLGFENTREVWFKNVHPALKFCLYVAEKRGTTSQITAAFNIRSVDRMVAVREAGGLRVPIEMVRDFSPDALAIMEFNDQREIDIATKMYARWPKFGDLEEGPPCRTYMTEVHMGSDRELFGGKSDGIPLFEGRMVDQFDHRAKGYRSGRGRSAVWVDLPFGSTEKSIQPQWHVTELEIPDKAKDRITHYRIGFCDVTSPTNERSLIATLLPPQIVAGHKVPTITFESGFEYAMLIWLAAANSFVVDFLVRKKVSLSMTYTVLDSIPFPRLKQDDSIARKIVPMVLKLVSCGKEMNSLVESFTAAGWIASEFRGVHDEMERIQLRAELDAIVAKDLYGLSVHEMEFILDSFSTQKVREEARHGEFTSSRLILEAMTAK